VSLVTLYRGLGSAARLDAQLAARIVASAKPRAAAALGGRELRVVTQMVSPEQARGGNLIPAWPRLDASGSVTIEYVEDWGALLAAWLSCVEPSVRELIDVRQRVWIGIANDVLQMFVTDPPPGSYSMVRHHALMLAAATLWLGPEAVSRWRRAHDSAARAFVLRHGLTGVESAERGLDALLSDKRCHQPVHDVLAWLDGDDAARRAYTEFLGAASLGVAAALAAFEDSGLDANAWLQLALVLHTHADFNRDWMARAAQPAAVR
jgi:hypothetical protein